MPGNPLVISLLHGPNLDLLGQREPHIYGTATLDDHIATASAAAAAAGLSITAFQTNHEGELVEAIHAARATSVAIIINAGGVHGTDHRAAHLESERSRVMASHECGVAGGDWHDRRTRRPRL